MEIKKYKEALINLGVCIIFGIVGLIIVEGIRRFG